METVKKCAHLDHYYIAAQSDFITCYTNVEGTEETRCSFSEGFTTCYTSYNISENNLISSI